MKKLYLDLDGVIINTNKFAQEEITKSGIDITQKNSLIELCKTFPWRCFLDNCEAINNSFEIVPKLSLKYDVTIITHCYSSLEADLKQNFIKNKFQNIKCITVPFKKKKNEVAQAKDSIWVDDYYVNVENWNHSGGMGIYFNNNLKDKKSLTISDLNYLLDNNFIERIGG